MVQAEPKSILSYVEQLESNNLIATATSGDPNPKAYRNNPTCLAEPKSIWNIDEKGNSEAKKLITPASGGPDKNAYRSNQSSSLRTFVSSSVYLMSACA